MQSDRRIVNLALIGFMGAGKTSVGRLVAEQLHFDYLDTDELIVSQTRAGALRRFSRPTASRPFARSNDRPSANSRAGRKPSSPPAAVCR